MGDNSLLLATYYGINGKNPAWHKSRLVRTVAPSSQEQPQGMDIWLTKNVNNGGHHNHPDNITVADHCLALWGVTGLKI
jgi:hypothetical protein